MASGYAVGTGASGLTGILLLPIVTHSLAADAYGQFAAAEATLAVLGVLSACGVNVALIAVWGDLPQSERDGYARSAAGQACLLACAIGLLVLIPIGAVQTALGGTVLMSLWQLAAAILIVEAWILVANTVMRAEERIGAYVRLNVTQSVVAAIVAIVLLLQAEAGVVALFWGRLSGAIAGALVTLPTMLRCRPQLDIARCRRLLTLGLPLVPSTVASSLISASPRLLLGRIAGDATLGAFAATARIAGAMNVFVIQPIALVWHPAMFRVVRSSVAAKELQLLSGLVACTALVVASILLLLLPLAGHLIWVGEFTLDQVVLACALLSGALLAMSYPANVGPLAVGKTDRQVMPYLAGLAAAMTLVAIGASVFGARGAAIGQTLGYLVLLVALRRESQRLFPFPLPSGALGVGVAAFGACLGLTLLPQALRRSAIQILVLTVLGFLVAAGAKQWRRHLSR